MSKPPDTMPHRPSLPPVAKRWSGQRLLALGDHRRMAWRSAGSPGRTAWLVLHGGPGSGAGTGLAAALDDGQHHLLLPDQRGSGSCRPRGDILRNSTSALVSDLERLRQALGIARWNLLAGSWGTVLALAYADRHPECVDRLLLRGAFAVRLRELRGVLAPSARTQFRAGPESLWPKQPGQGVCAVLGKLQQVLQSGTPGVTAWRLARHWGRLEMALALRGMERSMRHLAMADATGLAGQVRRQRAGLSRGLRRARAAARHPRPGRGDRAAWQKFRIQAHYLRHRGFVRPGGLDAAVRRLALRQVRMDWVHGRFDAVCPPDNSRRWHRLACLVDPAVSGLHLPVGGHLGSEPGLFSTLVRLVTP